MLYVVVVEGNYVYFQFRNGIEARVNISASLALYIDPPSLYVQVRSSADSKGGDTTKGSNNTWEVFRSEHPPLGSNRGTHLHMEKSKG